MHLFNKKMWWSGALYLFIMGNSFGASEQNQNELNFILAKSFLTQSLSLQPQIDSQHNEIVKIIEKYCVEYSVQSLMNELKLIMLDDNDDNLESKIGAVQKYFGNGFIFDLRKNIRLKNTNPMSFILLNLAAWRAREAQIQNHWKVALNGEIEEYTRGNCASYEEEWAISDPINQSVSLAVNGVFDRNYVFDLEFDLSQLETNLIELFAGSYGDTVQWEISNFFEIELGKFDLDGDLTEQNLRASALKLLTYSRATYQLSILKAMASGEFDSIISLIDQSMGNMTSIDQSALLAKILQGINSFPTSHLSAAKSLELKGLTSHQIFDFRQVNQ